MSNKKIGVIAIGIIVTIALIWIISAVVNEQAVVNDERVDVPLTKEEQVKLVNDIITITARELHSKLGRWAIARDVEKIDSYINKTMIVTEIEVKNSVRDLRVANKPITIHGGIKDNILRRVNIEIHPDNPANEKAVEKALTLKRDDIISVKTSLADFRVGIPRNRIVLGGRDADVQILDIKRGSSF